MTASKQVLNVKIKIYRAAILPVLYEFETWSLKLREDHRLRVFENKVMSKIFGAKIDDVTGKCIKLHSEVLHDMYPSSNIIRVKKSRRMRWPGHVEEVASSVWGVGDPEGSCRF
jgi:hypothetical protein